MELTRESQPKNHEKSHPQSETDQKTDQRDLGALKKESLQRAELTKKTPLENKAHQKKRKKRAI